MRTSWRSLSVHLGARRLQCDCHQHLQVAPQLSASLDSREDYLAPGPGLSQRFFVHFRYGL